MVKDISTSKDYNPYKKTIAVISDLGYFREAVDDPSFIDELIGGHNKTA